MKAHRHPLLASLLMVACAFASADSTAVGFSMLAASPTDSMSSSITCADAAPTSMKQAVLGAMDSQRIARGPKDVAAMAESFKRSGLTSGATSKLSIAARASVEAESALATRGLIVSAKMLHDDSKSIPDYKSSAFSASIARYLAIAVEPAHDSASHATAHAGAEADHDDGLEEVNRTLREVLKRVSTVKAGLGALYTEPEVRYYVLGHAFRDPVAVQAAARLVCAKGFTSAQMKSLEMSADFVRGRKVEAPAKKGVSK